jgi:hypothetical protein
MSKCPNCGSNNTDVLWCDYCSNTQVDSETGYECEHCCYNEMACNDCGYAWEVE